MGLADCLEQTFILKGRTNCIDDRLGLGIHFEIDPIPYFESVKGCPSQGLRYEADDNRRCRTIHLGDG